MADSRVLPISDVVVGIKAESTFAAAVDNTGPDGTAYRQLPVVQAAKPTFNTTRESRLLSGRGSIKNAADTITTQAGGTVTAPFEFVATPKLLAQHLVLVGQEHNESGSYIHEIDFNGTDNKKSIGGSVSSNLPHSVNLAYDTGTSAEGIRVTGVVCSDLSLGLDFGTSGGNMTVSGNYFSGIAAPVDGKTELEQTFDTTAFIAPETTFYNIGNLATKTLDVEGNANQALILKSFNLNIANGVNRVGSDSDGNAELYALPEYVITGDITIKYDDEFDYGAANNVIQDFLDGNTMSLALKWGDGTVSSAGEMNILAEIQYTGDPGQDISENGIFHTLPFECVQNSSTSALKITLFNGESQSAW